MGLKSILLLFSLCRETKVTLLLLDSEYTLNNEVFMLCFSLAIILLRYGRWVKIFKFQHYKIMRSPYGFNNIVYIRKELRKLR